MNDDAELLRRYTEENSEAAFAELVRRHLGLVYHAALRQCGGDIHRAQDVSQMVFVDLARKAATLTRRPVLAGWLYTSTRYAAVQTMRAVRRRQAREQEVHTMNELLSDSVPAVDWERLRPVIDDTLFALNEPDREAVLLRFFGGHTFAEVGVELGVTEDAARVRVSRAVEKMQALLGRRGVTSTSAALGLALANHAGAAAPAGLAAVVAGAAIAAASKGGMVAAVAFLGMTKVRIAILAVVLGAGATALVIQWRENVSLKTEAVAPAPELAALPQNEQRASMPPVPLAMPAVSRIPGSSADSSSADLGGLSARTAPPGLATRDPSYRLGIGDAIACSIQQEPELTSNALIDQNGVMHLTGAGYAELAGLTLRDAARVIEALYRERRSLKAPVVSLVVTAFGVREVTVFGEVRTPGALVFPRDLTSMDIVEVITRAGGFTVRAKSNAVTVIRRAADGKETREVVDVESMMKSGGASRTKRLEFPIYPGDRIIVGERVL